MEEQEIRTAIKNFLKEPLFSIVYEYCKTSCFAETHGDLKKNENILNCFLRVGKVVDAMMHIDMPLDVDYFSMCSIGKQAYWRDIVASMVIIILDNNQLVNDDNRKDYELLKRKVNSNEHYVSFVYKQKNNPVKEYKGGVKRIGLTIDQLKTQCEVLQPQERKDFLLRYKTDYEQAQIDKDVLNWIDKELDYLSYTSENIVEERKKEEQQEEIVPSLLYNIDFLKVLVKASSTKSKNNSTMYVTSGGSSYSWNGSLYELGRFAERLQELSVTQTKYSQIERFFDKANLSQEMYKERKNVDFSVVDSILKVIENDKK